MVRLSPARLFVRFLRFGVTAWGGPTAQIAVLRHELVERERWVDEGRFRRALAVYQALPGPEAHELCCWFGMNAGGRAGAIAAGLGFMLPGFVLMLAASWLYARFGLEHPLVRAGFSGAQAAVVGLVLVAALRLTRSIVPQAGRASGASWCAWSVTALGVVTQSLAAPFWIALVAGGIALACAARRATVWAGIVVVVAMVSAASLRPAEVVEPAPASSSRMTASPIRLFTTGLSGGLVSFGGAYTAIPVVRAEATGADGWMDDRQFLDGLAIGSVLPAPLVIFATFDGYLGGKFGGALLMTLGMFLPAFAFTLLGHGLIERLVANRAVHSFLDGVASAVCGVIAAISVMLFIDLAVVPTEPRRIATSAAVIAVATFVVLPRLRFRAAMPLVIGISALVGMVLGT